MEINRHKLIEIRKVLAAGISGSTYSSGQITYPIHLFLTLQLAVQGTFANPKYFCDDTAMPVMKCQ
jgi:hypothetical protein